MVKCPECGKETKTEQQMRFHMLKHQWKSYRAIEDESINIKDDKGAIGE